MRQILPVPRKARYKDGDSADTLYLSEADIRQMDLVLLHLVDSHSEHLQSSEEKHNFPSCPLWEEDISSEIYSLYLSCD